MSRRRTVEPSDHRAELEPSYQMAVRPLEFDEARDDQVNVGLAPHLHLRDLPIANEIAVVHGRDRVI